MKELFVDVEKLISRYQNLEKELKGQLKTMGTGKGHIVSSKSRGKYQYYRYYGNGKKKYLSIRTQVELIQKLCQKEYLEKALKTVQEDLVLLIKIRGLSARLIPIESVPQLLSPGVNEYVMPIVLTNEEYVAEWLAYGTAYLDNDAWPKEYITNRGDRVRSRAEQLIANYLYEAGIPYKYECPVYLEYGHFSYFPDFLILDVKNRKEILFEHFGEMSDPDYVRKTMQKIYDYQQSGYVLGDTLFFSFEDSESKFQLTYVMEALKYRLSLGEDIHRSL